MLKKNWNEVRKSANNSKHADLFKLRIVLIQFMLVNYRLLNSGSLRLEAMYFNRGCPFLLIMAKEASIININRLFHSREYREFFIKDLCTNFPQ
jgi:hypothetical protein